MLQVFHIPPNCTKSVLISLKHTDFFFSLQMWKIAVYPGNVLSLHMSKPQGFKYKSGQYMFVNCSAVSSFEWYVHFGPHSNSSHFIITLCFNSAIYFI